MRNGLFVACMSSSLSDYLVYFIKCNLLAKQRKLLMDEKVSLLQVVGRKKPTSCFKCPLILLTRIKPQYASVT